MATGHAALWPTQQRPTNKDHHTLGETKYMNEQEAIRALEEKLDALQRAKESAPLDIQALPASLQGLGQKMQLLEEHTLQLHRFAQDLANGDTSAAVPERNNHLAGPLKEIHSRLASFEWSMEQLAKGNVVSKLYFPGRLFDTYNSMIEKVANTLQGAPQESGIVVADSATSWRYHQFLSAVNQLRIMIVEVNEVGDILFMNPPARHMLGPVSRLPIDRADEESSPLLRYLCSFFAGGQSQGEIRLRRGDFPVFHEIHDEQRDSWFKVTGDCVRLANEATGLLFMVDDISHWKHNEAKLERSAAIDPLTLAYTRKAGLQKLEECIRKRDQVTTTIAFVDIDGLKEVNDRLGHIHGDQVIKQIAQVIQGSVRAGDWVVRYGGDEFIVIFEGSTEAVAAKAIERMYENLAIANERQQTYALSFSVGLKQLTSEIADITTLISVADEKMYRAKQKGKRKAK